MYSFTTVTSNRKLSKNDGVWRYYQIDKNNARKIPVPMSRNIYDFSGVIGLLACTHHKKSIEIFPEISIHRLNL